jgi:acetolactate synthase-1/2/3 large subunit
MFVKCLQEEGVDTVFGYQGGAAMPLFDALYDADIKFIMNRHEQGTAHAAEGYARASGKVGVCLVTSGPGATNLVTGIADAHMDSVPIICFTGQVATHLIGNDAFQEADIIGITRPITKHSYIVMNVKDIARTIKEAFYIASTGRPGPIVVDMPRDVSRSKTTFKYPDEVNIRGYKPTLHGNIPQIKRAAQAIAAARRPVIYTGGGIMTSGASEELLQLVEVTGIPVTNTLMGLGGFPGTHRLFLGMLGMHGTWYANTAVHNCDLLISIGARFDDRVTGKIEEFVPGAKIIHIDIDPAAIEKNIKVDIPIVGDAKNVLKELNTRVKPCDISDWWAQIEKWKSEHPLYYKDEGQVIKPQYVIEELYRLTKGDAIITTGVGQHQMWVAQYYRFNKPRTFLSSSGLGTMGWGLPAAVGASLAQPKKAVVCVEGDGGFQMTFYELATAVQYRLPLKVVVINNEFMGMVRQWQQMFYNRRYAYSCIPVAPDFVKLAQSFGIKGLRAVKKDEVASVLEEGLSATDAPAVMEFRVAREENVFPMIPSGAAIHQMIEAEVET